MYEVSQWLAGEEPKPAPMPLLLVQGFVNTRDLEEGTDLLADPETGRDWLVQAGLLDPAARPRPAEFEFARQVRESLRTLLARGRDREGDDAEALAPLRRLAASHAARLTVADDGLVGLESARFRDLGDGLFEILLIVHGAQSNGTWQRLKVCANPECRWAFFDRSRNQQGSWCEMAVCGNRLKNRELRARRR